MVSCEILEDGEKVCLLPILINYSSLNSLIGFSRPYFIVMTARLPLKQDPNE